MPLRGPEHPVESAAVSVRTGLHISAISTVFTARRVEVEGTPKATVKKEKDKRESHKS